MNINADNVEFLLQNNPEHVVVSLIEDVKYVNRLSADRYTQIEDKFENEINQIKSVIWNLSKEIQFNKWYLSQPFYKKLWWRIKKLSIEDIKSKIFKF